MAGGKLPWQHSRVLRVTFLTLALLTPLAAHAQEDAVARARAALRDGDPERAVAILERAGEDEPDPEIDRELYVAHEQLGHHDEAGDHLERYLEAESDLDPDERADLEDHLDALRTPRSRPARGDPALVIAGWAQLGAGIAGLVVSLAAAGTALALDNNRTEDCMAASRLCAPGTLDTIRDTWTASATALGAGLVLTLLGAIDLVVADISQPGAAQSLPPELDPTVQRVFTFAPWVDDRGGGAAVRLVF